MAVKVKLENIVEGMEFQSDEIRNFLNRETGEVVLVSDEEFRAAEGEEPLEEYPEWQRNTIKVAGEILSETDKYLPLPDKFEIHEWKIMDRFCRQIEDAELRDIMFDAIRGRGAFRMFKDSIRRYDIEDDWYRFREETFKEKAIEWCEFYGIEYVE